MRYLKDAFASGWFGVLITGLLTVALLYQSWQVNHPPVRGPAELKAGDRLPSVRLGTLDGRTVDVNWQTRGKPTIVYFFRPDCVWCARNMPALKVLLAAVPQYGFIGISPASEGVETYLKSNGLPLEVYIATDREAIGKLKLTGTPETILLTPAGAVEEVWRGVYRGRNKTQIEERFGVMLPEVKITDTVQHPGA